MTRDDLKVGAVLRNKFSNVFYVVTKIDEYNSWYRLERLSDTDKSPYYWEVFSLIRAYYVRASPLELLALQ